MNKSVKLIVLALTLTICTFANEIKYVEPIAPIEQQDETNIVSIMSTPSNMVLITVGSSGTVFKMGNKDPIDGVEFHMPVHYVKMTKSYYMDKYEVTKQLWDTVYNWAIINGYKFEDCVAAGNGPNHPVYRVTWFDVAKWCNARSEMESLTPVYYLNDSQTKIFKQGKDWIKPSKCKKNANGYRLPTEAEWEFAACGISVAGHPNKEDLFPWPTSSQSASKFAVINASSTAPVGSKKAGNHGLYDMAGNVYEWCYEVNYFYSSNTVSNPQIDPWQPSVANNYVSPAGNYRHIARGGSFLSNENRANTWRRNRMYEQWARFRTPVDKQFGFRTVRSAK